MSKKENVPAIYLVDTNEIGNWENDDVSGLYIGSEKSTRQDEFIFGHDGNILLRSGYADNPEALMEDGGFYDEMYDYAKITDPLKQEDYLANWFKNLGWKKCVVREVGELNESELRQ